eukprot:TRINITY_DN20794_c0_g1_i1.p1 TRINITY_DN20794_c0_g1~~TRINITY_DN20794_c0_g1_i1.p1  ORF type:complete len:472 (+),score=48.31 TRINITY_DN20794_c0_g1_i1:98-1513(+)
MLVVPFVIFASFWSLCTGHSVYNGTCGYSRHDRDMIRAQVITALARKGYNPRLKGSVFHRQSFNPSSYDFGYTWEKPKQVPAVPWFNDNTVYQREPSDVSLWLGCNPPVGPIYYGFTNYLLAFDSKHWKGPLSTPAGSLGDTLNQLTMNYTDGQQKSSTVWGTTSAVIYTDDEVSAMDTEAALSEAHFPAHAVNIQTVPSLMPGVKQGLGPEYNVFQTGGRIALWPASESKDAFMAYEEPVILFSARGRSHPAMPMPTPTLKDRAVSRHFTPDKSELTAIRDEVAKVVAKSAKDDGWDLLDENELQLQTVSINGTNEYLNGSKCIQDPSKKSWCFEDTQDAAYFVSSFVTFGFNVKGYLVGIDHNRTGDGVYGSVSWSKSSVASGNYEGTGKVAAPDVSGSDNAFVVKMMRKCPEHAEDCLSVNLLGKVIERVYLNPATGTGPDVHGVVRTKLLRFKKRFRENTELSGIFV